MIGYAVTYYQDMVRPNKTYRQPSAEEAGAYHGADRRAPGASPDADAEAIQSAVYATGKQAGYETCGHGSSVSTRCSLASRKGRAWDPSSPFMVARSRLR